MTKIIPLSQGKVALIDEADFNRVNKYKWYFNNGYVMHAEYFGKKVKMYLLHRFIMNTPKGMDTDHKNGDKLDNRQENLRICNRSENNQNRLKVSTASSVYKGVSWNKKMKKWKSQVKLNKKPYYIGSFVKEIHAAMAYDMFAKDLHGEFAQLNFKI